MLENKKAVIFDLDGTLVDSMWIWREIDIRFLGKYGLEVPQGLNDKLEGYSFHETAVYFKEHFPLPLTIEEIKYVRLHPTLGYAITSQNHYSDFIIKSILYHHENYDGTCHT